MLTVLKKRGVPLLEGVPLRIPDIHNFISDMVLLHTKNKAVSLKVANSVVHVNNAATSTKLKDKVDRSSMNTLMSIS